MRKTSLENMILTGLIELKRDSGKQRVFDELEKMDGRIGFGRNNKKTILSTSFKQQEYVGGTTEPTS